VIEKKALPSKPISFQIKKANLSIERDAIINYLLPYEIYSLFLIANLKDKEFPSEYYVAKRENEIVGIAAYFPIFQSFSLFTEYSEVSKEFAHLMTKNHEIKTFLGIADCARDAYLELLKLGYKSKTDFKHVFMELDLENFHFFDSKEGKIRTVEEKDIDQVVILHRYFHHQSKDDPITEEERNKIRLSQIKYCLEIDNKIVCSAVSNGMVYKAFQILGVSTHLDYRRRGFAKAVCSYLIRYFQKQENAKNAVIFTDYDNIPALRCYHALGFKITNEYYFANF
ncbi:MAG: hypothetical protein K940chlam8_00713, partial [Chlamydiae bacterium]|nr:hypothetical protein [Chlamydiota bacterium]